jgi:hypothetical protein
MRRPTILPALLLATVFASLAPAALASPAASPAEAKPYKEAVKLESDGDVVGALAKFESIPEAKRDFLVRLHIASCKHKLGRFLASQRDLEGILADPKVDAATRETAQSDLDDLRARTPKVSLRVSPATTGVVVTLDGEVVAAPAGRALDPGAHVVIATRDGTQVFKRELQLTEATAIDVEIDAPTARTTPPAPVTANPTPIAPPVVGTSGSGLRTTGWILVAVGGVAGLGAAGAWWQSSSAYDDWKASCGLTGCDDDKASRVRTWDRTKVVGAGLAVVAVGVGVTLLVAAPNGSGVGEKPPAASLSVRATSGAITGVVLEGRF